MGKLVYKAVFFDMDGVLTDIIGCFKKLFHLPKDWKSTTYFVEGQLDMSWEDFHKKIFDAGEELWTYMDPIEEGVKLIRDFLKMNDNGLVLSSPIEGPNSASGKVKWLNKHIPELGQRYILTHNKEFISAPGRVLIDDYGQNIIEWEKYGGKGLLLRTTYSHEYGKDCSFDEMRELLL